MGWLAIPPASKAAISPIVLRGALLADSFTGRLLGFAVATAAEYDRSDDPAGVPSAQDRLRRVGELVVWLAIRRRAQRERLP